METKTFKVPNIGCDGCVSTIKNEIGHLANGVKESEDWLDAARYADTNGYHRGGLARTGDRVMYTCMYTSRASESDMTPFGVDRIETPRPFMTRGRFLTDA